ncbi:copper chaperone PCu(A)C [Pseudoalteromonas mariniglutinosa]|uniref:copper chaperone PCu(A)C n=1 Tax=Pseudoalteromonas mariniglutinosa TaxID=206042 RepID=UPI00384AA6E5
MKLLTTLVFFASLLNSTMVLAHEGHLHSASAEMQVSNAQVRVFLPGSDSSVAYFTLTNNSDYSATLTKASLDGLGRVEIHQHSHVDGMMKMEKVASVAVEAHSQVNFQPGGFHLMLFEPQETLKVGQELKLTLYFNDGNRIFTHANVVSLQAMSVEKAGKDEAHSHH